MSQDNPKTPLHQMSLFGPEPGSSASSAGITPSAYQEAIFEFVLNGQGDGLINAVAGAGKTWVLVQAAQLIRLLPGPRRRATFAAFNRHIADTLKARLKGTPMTANTINGIGHGCLMKRLAGRVIVDDDKYKPLAKAWVEDELLVQHEFQQDAARYDLINAFLTLLRLTRFTLTPPTDAEALTELAARFDVSLPEFALPGIAEVLQQGETIAVDYDTIDFADQLWLPHRWELYPPPMDFVFVDEAQDLSPAQLELVLKSRAESGRFLFVGDPAQSIMAFAGADARAFGNIQQRTGATELPLSICYRCPRSHLRIAQTLVPHIEARPDAPEGVVELLPESELAGQVKNGDLILCRMTAPLVAWCIKLIQAQVYARVRGVDVGAGLISVARRASEVPNFDYTYFEFHLNAYESQQREYLAGRKHSAGQLQALKDKCDALRVCYQSFKVQTLDDRDHACAGTIYLIWEPGQVEAWCLFTNSPRHIGRYYAVHWWQEESFRDLKSAGWQWPTSHLICPQRMERLLLVMAIAYAFAISVGVQVWQQPPRLRAETATPDELPRLSLFRLGLRYLRRVLTEVTPLPVLSLAFPAPAFFRRI